MWTHSVPVWAEVEEHVACIKKVVRYVEKVGEEKESVCSSRHFVNSATVEKLVAFYAWSERERERFSASIPF